MKKLLVLLLVLVGAAAGAGAASATDPFVVKYAVPTSVASSLGSLDPATATANIFQAQAEYMTCANLFNHPDVDLSKGGRVVPEVATDWPSVSADGLTYTFTLKTTYKFSDGTLVTPSAYSTEITRVKAMTDPGFRAYANDIVSAVPDDSAHTLTITLSAQHGDLPDRLAMPIFCPVLPGTASTATVPPATGPYMSGTTSAGSALTLVRNPYYTGTRPRNPDSIEFIGVSALAGSSIDAGTYDVTDQLSNTDFSSAGSTWGPGTQNALTGDQRLFVKPNNGLTYLALNTNRVLGNQSLRLAVNYAIDRSALMQPTAPYAQTAWSQYLTPGIPGFLDSQRFPISADVATAQNLLAASGVGNPQLVIWCQGQLTNVRCSQANTIKSNLAAIGLTNVTVTNPSNFFTAITDPTAQFDIAITGWNADFVDPGNIIVPLLHKGSPNNSSFWNSDTWSDGSETGTQRMDNALKLVGDDRYNAFGQLATEISAAAPIAVISQGNWRFYFSPRIGCQTINPQYGVALGSLCLPDVAQQPVAAGGTVSTGSTTSSNDPVASSVTSPVAGSVSIDKSTTLNDAAPSGYSFIGQQFTIEAPQANQDNPLVLTFLVDSSIFTEADANGNLLDPNGLQLFRNGDAIQDCTTASGAYPDPCVVRPPTQSAMGYSYTVRTSHASRWNFGKPNFKFGGFLQPVDARPTFNVMKAGAAVPVKFSLGKNFGPSIFALSYPRSVTVACGSSSTPTDAVEQTVTAGSSSLSYDVTANQYTYVWKTDKPWAGSCRQLILRLADGSEQRANFQFTK